MKRIKYIKQHDEKDCGAACLNMILDYYGRLVPLSAIRQDIKVDRNGVNVYGIIDGAEKYGLTTEALEGAGDDAWQEINAGEYSFPFMIRILNDSVYEHFVVVYGMKQGKMMVMDPAKGRRVLSKEEFLKCFLGHLITFVPNKNFERKNERKSTYHRYVQLITRQKGLLAVAVVISLFTMVIGVSGMYLFRYIIDSVFSNLSTDELLEESVELLSLLIFFMGILYFLKWGLTILRAKIMARINKNIDLPLMLGYYNHVTELSLSFFNTIRTGEIMSRFEDATKIREAISGSMITITLDSFMVIGCGFALYMQSTALFRIALIIFLSYFVIAMLYIKPLSKSNREVMLLNADLTAFLKESTDGIETVKSLRAEGMIRTRTESIYGDFVNKNIKNSLLNTRKEAIIELMTSIGTLIVLWIGTMQVISGDITVGALITFTSLMNLFLSPVQELVQLQGNIQTAVVAADRLNDILYVEKERTGGESPDTGVENIEFKHVDFRYGNRELILKDFSLNVSKGEKVALIGESGCGKSTAAKLIMGLYSPEKGTMRINGIAVENCSIDYLRQQIAYVPQATYLFTGTIRENLLMGSVGYQWTDQEIDQILDICQCQFIKRMPLGIDSMVDENGANLSGGQKQRIAIARALLGSPSVLILDESTSALDAVTESKILEGIEENYPSLTVITVTHRLMSIISYDRIYVIDKGKVLEQGKHNELITDSKVYAGLWDAQLQYLRQSAS